CVRKEDDLDFW
nr:immunoglobulin heavy chain junction region [Macaca mulatta]